MSHSLSNIFYINKIVGKFCSLIPIEAGDAQLLVDLRSARGDYLRQGEITLESQAAYLKQYLHRYQQGEEIYFKIFDNNLQVDAGVTRLTQLADGEYFNFESGVMRSNAVPNLYLDAYFMCLHIGFEYFNKSFSGPWTIDRRNHRMLQLHKQIGMVEAYDEDERYIYLLATKELYRSNVERYQRLGFGRVGNLYALD